MDGVWLSSDHEGGHASLNLPPPGDRVRWCGDHGGELSNRSPRPGFWEDVRVCMGGSQGLKGRGSQPSDSTSEAFHKISQETSLHSMGSEKPCINHILLLMHSKGIEKCEV